MTKTSSLQLNLFVSQPDPLTKEQLFSAERRNALKSMFTDEAYNFYKENTRFVSYQELLWKLAQMKDWLNDNITDWDKTCFFSHDKQHHSNERITKHFYNNLQKNIHYIESKHAIDFNKYNTFIIADDCSYSWEDLLEQLKVFLINSIILNIKIIFAVPYMSHRAFQLFSNFYKSDNIELIFPDIIEKVPMICWLNRNRPELTDDDYNWPFISNWTLLIFAHKKADHKSIPRWIDYRTKDYKSPYDRSKRFEDTSTTL